MILGVGFEFTPSDGPDMSVLPYYGEEFASTLNRLAILINVCECVCVLFHTIRSADILLQGDYHNNLRIT